MEWYNLLILALTFFALVFSFKKEKIDLIGFVSAIILGFFLFIVGKIVWILPIFIFFVFGSFFSIYENEFKKGLKVNQKKRTWKNVLANGGAALIFALMVIIFPAKSELLFLAMVCSLSVALADTAATELGQIYGKNPVLVTNLEKTRVGTPGAITKEGLLFSLIGSSIIASYLLIVGFSYKVFIVVTFIGFLGGFIDSILGCSLEKRKIINTHTINFLTTLFGGILIFLIFYFRVF